MWNPGNSDEPQSFMEALYGNSDDESSMEEECFEEWESESGDYEEEIDQVPHHRPDSPSLTPSPYSPITRSPSLTPPPYSLITRPQSAELSPVQVASAPRSRSRSPLYPWEPRILATFDEHGAPMYEEFGPDPHALYESAERLANLGVESAERLSGRGRSSLRGRGWGRRGGRVGGRGQGRGRGGQRRRQNGWQPGDPLEEIWVTDDDVPLELREMAKDVIKRRQMRVEALHERRVRGGVSALNEEHNSEMVDDDVFFDAIGGSGDPVLKGVNPHFEWSPMETFEGVEEPFVPQRTGSVDETITTPYDAFRSYWTDDILDVIVSETNRYASRLPSASFKAGWIETNVHEILCLFAFWMMTGIIRMPTLRSYFSTNALLKTEVFSRITSLKRYNNLNRALHFVDTSRDDLTANPTTSDAASSDPLHRLRPIIDHLNLKFQSNYVLSKDICIDESLTLWKGSLKFKQYIRSKAAKFGIKTFELCESATGYLWSFLVYTGKDTAIDAGIVKSTVVVLELIKPLLNKGYRLFMDNWFNSPLLARILKRNGTDCVGTLCESRVDVPKLVTHAPLQRGQLVARHSGDVCVLSWMDKKRVTMISTCHGTAVAQCDRPSRTPSRPDPYKPQSVLDFNRAMGGVDLKDQMLEPYLLERKRCAKWYIKLFKRLLNCSIHNSRVLLESALKARLNNLEFRLKLVQGILDKHHSKVEVGRQAPRPHSSAAPLHDTVSFTHWPVRVQDIDSFSKTNRQSRLRCVVCLREGRKNYKSCFKCETCQVPLCVDSCFKKYHTSSA